MEHSSHIYIGTSGWHYKHWKGRFYPLNIANEHLLNYYVSRFDTVEINNTFYRLPEEHIFTSWKAVVPSSFIFSVKASRYITHIKKFKDTETMIDNFMTRIKILGDNLGPVLFQMPPHWKTNPGRLMDFLQSLPAGYRYAFEFRDDSWFEEPIETLLSERGAAFCIYDFAGRESPHFVTSDFVYMRLNGPAEPYKNRYERKMLSRWADSIMRWVNEGKDVFCYFDNDEMAYAVENASTLKQMIKL